MIFRKFKQKLLNNMHESPQVMAWIIYPLFYISTLIPFPPLMWTMKMQKVKIMWQVTGSVQNCTFHLLSPSLILLHITIPVRRQFNFDYPLSSPHTCFTRVPTYMYEYAIIRAPFIQNISPKSDEQACHIKIRP